MKINGIGVEVLLGDGTDQEDFIGFIEVEVGSSTTDGPVDVVIDIEWAEESVAARLTPFQAGKLVAALQAAFGEPA